MVYKFDIAAGMLITVTVAMVTVTVTVAMVTVGVNLIL